LDLPEFRAADLAHCASPPRAQAIAFANVSRSIKGFPNFQVYRVGISFIVAGHFVDMIPVIVR